MSASPAMNARVTGPRAAADTKPGRNDPCPCGSGRKYKQCCAAGPRVTTSSGSTAEPRANLVDSEASSAPARREAAFRMDRAARLRKAGRWSESIAELEGCVRLYPCDASVHHDLGLSYLFRRRYQAGIAHLQRAVFLKPEFAQAYYHLGMALQQQGRGAEAIAALQRGIALAPRHAEAQSRLGDFLLADGERAAAIECFRRAAAAAPNTTGGRLSRAKSLLAEEDFAGAEQQLRRAMALDPAGSAAHWILGRALIARGRFAAAVVELERAIALGPDDPTIYYDLVTAKRITEADGSLIARIRAALTVPGLCDRDRTGLEYALGKAFDDLGDYAEAIRHFDEANRLNGRCLMFDRAGLAAQSEQLMACFTASLLASYRQYGADDETPLLIVGMPRSGTTLVEQILSSHSSIGAGGELHFWGDTASAFTSGCAAEPASTDFAKWAADYLALLRRRAPAKARVTDKMPANFRWLGQIHATFPNARIIHVRRHPIDTCLSNYFTYFGRLHPQTCSRADLVFYYREYRRLMQHWRSVLPPGRLLEIDYEALVADRERITRELIAFAGLAWDDACLNPERNERVVYTASSWQARQPVYRTSLERWRRYEPWLGELRELLPEAALAGGEESG